MRTHEFEFKKTIKRVKKFKAISIDLTVAEAKELLAVLTEDDEHLWRESVTPEELAMDGIWLALADFVHKNGADSE